MSAAQAERELLLHAALGVGVPALTSVFVLAVAQLRGAPGGAGRRAAPALATALGFAAGYVAIQGWPPWSWELGIRQWLFYWALGLGLLALREALDQRARPLQRALLSVLAPLLLLEFQRAQHWTRLEGVGWSAGLALGLFASWQALSAHERRHGHPASALGWAGASALAAGAYLFSGSQTIAQLGGALALSCGASALFGVAWRAPGLGPAGVGPFLVLYQGLVWCGRFISDLSWPGFVLLSLAPLGVLAPLPRTRAGELLRAALPLLVAGLAAVLEFRDQPAAAGAYGR